MLEVFGYEKFILKRITALLLNYASAFVPPAAGILAYFFTNYSTTKIVLQDSGAIEISSELLRSRFNGSNPQTSKF